MKKLYCDKVDDFTIFITKRANLVSQLRNAATLAEAARLESRIEELDNEHLRKTGEERANL